MSMVHGAVTEVIDFVTAPFVSHCWIAFGDFTQSSN